MSCWYCAVAPGKIGSIPGGEWLLFLPISFCGEFFLHHGRCFFGVLGTESRNLILTWPMAKL